MLMWIWCPFWLGERSGMVDSTDVISFECATKPLTGKDWGIIVYRSGEAAMSFLWSYWNQLQNESKVKELPQVRNWLDNAGRAISSDPHFYRRLRRAIWSTETFADLKSTYVKTSFRKSRFERNWQANRRIQIPDPCLANMSLMSGSNIKHRLA